MNPSAKLLCGCLVVLLILILGTYILQTSTITPTQEELSNPQLINAFCKDRGYDYGISYNTDSYNQSESYPAGELNRLGLFTSVTCYRTIHEQKHFNNYGGWAKNKILIVIEK